MSHEIEYRNEQYSMAHTGDIRPWHGLGQDIDDDAPVEEWLKAAGLDWTVSTRHVFLEGSTTSINQFRALVRDYDETVLDMVGPDWEPIQNYRAMEWFDLFRKAGKLSIKTAGSLRGGRDVWVLAQSNGGFEIKGEPIESYVLFDNPHQRARAALIIPTPICVVCANTQGWALRKHENQQRKLEARFTHVGEGRFSVESALEQLGIVDANFLEWQELATRLADKTCRDEDYVGFVKRVYGLRDPNRIEDAHRAKLAQSHNDRIVKALLEIRDTQPGADIASRSGTWWGAYNAVTYDVDHSPRRNVGQDRAIGSAWLGVGAKRKALARDVALEMAD